MIYLYIFVGLLVGLSIGFFSGRRHFGKSISSLNEARMKLLQIRAELLSIEESADPRLHSAIHKITKRIRTIL